MPDNFVRNFDTYDTGETQSQRKVSIALKLVIDRPGPRIDTHWNCHQHLQQRNLVAESVGPGNQTAGM
jgi:hypothetical protein